MSSNIASLASAGIGQARAPQDPRSERNVRNLFKVLHGKFGNLFLSRYATGDLDDNQRDRGVQSAMLVWSRDLAKFDGATIEAALEQCLEKDAAYPPNLPQLVQACRARAPREAYAPDNDAVKAIPMGAQLQSSYARRAREINAKYSSAKVAPSDLADRLPAGLDGLKQAIANAVATAGGDEVEALLRLDRDLAPRREARAA